MNEKPTIDEMKMALDGQLEAGRRPSSHDPVHPDSDRACDYCGGTEGRMGRLGWRTLSTPSGRRRETIWGHLDGCPEEDETMKGSTALYSLAFALLVLASGTGWAVLLAGSALLPRERIGILAGGVLCAAAGIRLILRGLSWR